MLLRKPFASADEISSVPTFVWGGFFRTFGHLACGYSLHLGDRGPVRRWIFRNEKCTAIRGAKAQCATGLRPRFLHGEI